MKDQLSRDLLDRMEVEMLGVVDARIAGNVGDYSHLLGAFRRGVSVVVVCTT